jgi:hypothetical protein
MAWSKVTKVEIFGLQERRLRRYYQDCPADTDTKRHRRGSDEETHRFQKPIEGANMNLKAWALSAALVTVTGQTASQAQTWTQTGMLSCKLNPSIGFVIFGHQSMECQFVPTARGAPQIYEGALNTVGIDIGIVGTGGLAWGVLAPTAGVPAGALAGTYVGASGDIALGAGVGANVLVGGSNRSFALQPLSVEGSVALDVTLGLSALQLRWVPTR